MSDEIKNWFLSHLAIGGLGGFLFGFFFALMFQDISIIAVGIFGGIAFGLCESTMSHFDRECIFMVVE